METVKSLTDDASWDEVLEASERAWEERPQATFPSVLEIAHHGERIYEQRYKRDFEARYLGKFVAIDVESERSYLGSTPKEATFEALRASPGACLFFIRVGFEAAFDQRGPYRDAFSDGLN